MNNFIKLNPEDDINDLLMSVLTDQYNADLCLYTMMDTTNNGDPILYLPTNQNCIFVFTVTDPVYWTVIDTVMFCTGVSLSETEGTHVLKQAYENNDEKVWWREFASMLISVSANTQFIDGEVKNRITVLRKKLLDKIQEIENKTVQTTQTESPKKSILSGLKQIFSKDNKS